ncbi:flagellar M-ring protein FliF C-terminal domain-containing protein [Pedomonas mirosovicensis]|uniref:flagellar M-ring protein FliF C-terminal domain-containing protein n=1 Tax=Pedomonas mirosovicensis TaxID=2908641 RepID=UPI00216A7C0B|nr:flagellar M-ring protein FliF C-terminal domain-containing protein [Pedomonas mirosovicensis]
MPITCRKTTRRTSSRAPAPSSTSNEVSEQIEYQNSRTHTTTMRNAGSIKRLSVAVMVDGVYAGEGDKATYKPRPPQELEQFRRLVQNAIGYDEGRGDSVVVENLRFAQTNDGLGTEAGSLPLGLESDSLIRLAEIGVIGLLGLLGFFFILRPILKAMKGQAQPAAPEGQPAQIQAPAERLALAPPDNVYIPQELIERAAAGDEEAIRMIQVTRGKELGIPVESEIDVAQIEGKLKTSALKKVGDVIERNPSEAVAIIRQWMYS